MATHSHTDTRRLLVCDRCNVREEELFVPRRSGTLGPVRLETNIRNKRGGTACVLHNTRCRFVQALPNTSVGMDSR